VPDASVRCPSCRRDNAAHRRYCGGCGCNFDPACAACGFANEPRDRFCGGCGLGLVGAAVRAATIEGVTTRLPRLTQPLADDDVVEIQDRARPTTGHPDRRRTPTSAPSPWAAEELAELFQPAPPEEKGPALPEAGILQSDVDRLFGSLP